MEASGFAIELILTGAAATFVAYLFFWPIVYALARRVFGFKRDVSAVLASGISVCGVSAAIATAGAIRAKPVIPVTISMVVVIFAMLELIVLPGLYTAFLPDQPIVNGAALGMTVKTDGADAAAGALLDELMIARHLQLTGEQWQEGWILSASLLTKIWIDVFIGVWAFLLAIVWIRKVEKREGAVQVERDGDLVPFPEVRARLFLAWFVYLAIAWRCAAAAATLDQGTAVVQSPMRTMLFMLTFVAMGAITDFSKLKGMGRVAFLYGLALVVVIAPIAYAVAYLFHRGLAPPLRAVRSHRIMSKYVGAIDQGTTSSRFIVFDQAGRGRRRRAARARADLSEAGLGRARRRGDLAQHGGGDRRGACARRRTGRASLRPSASRISARRRCCGTATRVRRSAQRARLAGHADGRPRGRLRARRRPGPISRTHGACRSRRTSAA